MAEAPLARHRPWGNRREAGRDTPKRFAAWPSSRFRFRHWLSLLTAGMSRAPAPWTSAVVPREASPRPSAFDRDPALGLAGPSFRLRPVHAALELALFPGSSFVTERHLPAGSAALGGSAASGEGGRRPRSSGTGSWTARRWRCGPRRDVAADVEPAGPVPRMPLPMGMTTAATLRRTCCNLLKSGYQTFQITALSEVGAALLEGRQAARGMTPSA